VIGVMKQLKNSKRMSISLDKDYRTRLTYLAELEHRRLGEQIVHMMEFYLRHQIETKNMVDEYIQHHYEPSNDTLKFNKPLIEDKGKPQVIKTSQVLQENKGVVVSDVPDKKVKTEFDNQQDI
jgi:hypothetical protein